MRRLTIILGEVWRPLLVGLIGLALLAGVLGYQLGSLMGGVSEAEQPVVQAVQGRTLSARDIANDPLFLPYKLGMYALEKIGLTSVGAIRAIGAVCGFIGAIAFYLLLLKWHTRRIAILGTLLLATSSWFLTSARLAVPESAYLLLPFLFYLGAKLEQGEQRLPTAAACFVGTALLLYIPGLVWFVMPGIIWQRRRILNRLSELNSGTTIPLAILAILMLVPLGYGFFMGDASLPAWLGMDVAGLTPMIFIRNLLDVPMQLIIRTEANAAIHLGTLPLLDIATTIFAGLGVYWYFFQRSLDRVKLIVAGLVVSALLIALNGNEMLSLLIPFVYVVAAAGITLMLQQWFTVFPRNPLARGLGVSLVIVVVGLISFYHLQRYFVAWPNTPETKQAYSHHF